MKNVLSSEQYKEIINLENVGYFQLHDDNRIAFGTYGSVCYFNFDSQNTRNLYFLQLKEATQPLITSVLDIPLFQTASEFLYVLSPDEKTVINLNKIDRMYKRSEIFITFRYTYTVINFKFDSKSARDFFYDTIIEYINPHTIEDVLTNGLEKSDPASEGTPTSLSWKYTFSIITTEGDPGDGKFRINNLDPTLATEMYVDCKNYNGDDLTILMMSLIRPESIIYAQDRTNSTRRLKYSITTYPENIPDRTGYVKFGISWIDGTSLNDNDTSYLHVFIY